MIVILAWIVVCCHYRLFGTVVIVVVRVEITASYSSIYIYIYRLGERKRERQREWEREKDKEGMWKRDSGKEWDIDGSTAAIYHQNHPPSVYTRRFK